MGLYDTYVNPITNYSRTERFCVAIGPRGRKMPVAGPCSPPKPPSRTCPMHCSSPRRCSRCVPFGRKMPRGRGRFRRRCDAPEAGGPLPGRLSDGRPADRVARDLGTSAGRRMFGIAPGRKDCRTGTGCAETLFRIVLRYLVGIMCRRRASRRRTLRGTAALRTCKTHRNRVKLRHIGKLRCNGETICGAGTFSHAEPRCTCP